MKGCGDVAWFRIQRIQRAGIKRVIEYARNHTGVQNPERDVAVIRSVAVLGYKEAGDKHGLSSGRVQDIVKRYSEMAAAILSGESEAPAGADADGMAPWRIASALRRCGQGGDGCNSDCPYWALHCAEGDCVGKAMADAAWQLEQMRGALDEICVHLDAGSAIVDWTKMQLQPGQMPEVQIPGSNRRYVAVKDWI